MTNSLSKILFLFVLLLLQVPALCQTDTTKATSAADSTQKHVVIDSFATTRSAIKKVDSSVLKHSPRKAAIRSAILPGWGQAYNKKYWKIPIVYGALGVTGSIFVYNLKNYKDLRFAYKAKYNASIGDSSGLPYINPSLQPLSINALRTYRDEFRRNVDYSAVFFLLFWGLNVVDATVDAHLRSFDVSPDLSFRFKIGHSDVAGTNGLSFILAFK